MFAGSAPAIFSSLESGKVKGIMAEVHVGIIMGSESDKETMGKGAAVLDELGIGYEIVVSSAHRIPDRTAEWARAAALLVCVAVHAVHHMLRRLASLVRARAPRTAPMPTSVRLRTGRDTKWATHSRMGRAVAWT